MAPVTVGDYDNFNLGNDFAECHISANPMNPLQFFTAYNINGTHHTEDGYNWSINTPSFPSAAGDPVTAYDSLGNLFYETMKSPITGTWVVKSLNNGQTWSSAVSGNTGVDKNWYCRRPNWWSVCKLPLRNHDKKRWFEFCKKYK